MKTKHWWKEQNGTTTGSPFSPGTTMAVTSSGSSTTGSRTTTTSQATGSQAQGYPASSGHGSAEFTGPRSYHPACNHWADGNSPHPIPIQDTRQTMDLLPRTKHQQHRITLQQDDPRNIPNSDDGMRWGFHASPPTPPVNMHKTNPSHKYKKRKDWKNGGL